MEVEMNSYKKLCIYCFDVLLNHLNNIKKDTNFPEEFQGVHIIILILLEILSVICNMDNRNRKRIKRMHRYFLRRKIRKESQAIHTYLRIER